MTWQDVLDLVSAPIQSDARMLEQKTEESVYDILQRENHYYTKQRLEVAGVCREDIPPIIEALEKLQPKFQRCYQPIGAITYMGNEPTEYIHMFYQSAVILVDVPRVCSGSRNSVQCNTASQSVSTRLMKTVFWNKAQVVDITSNTGP